MAFIFKLYFYSICTAASYRKNIEKRLYRVRIKFFRVLSVSIHVIKWKFPRTSGFPEWRYLVRSLTAFIATRRNRVSVDGQLRAND